MKGIAFGMGHLEAPVKSGKAFSAAFVLEENDFRGVKSIEMGVKDLKFNDQ